MYPLSPPNVITGSSHQRNQDYRLTVLLYNCIQHSGLKTWVLVLYIIYLFLFLKVLSKYILIQVHVSWVVRCVVSVVYK